MVELSGSGKALAVTLLFRLLFGGYLVGKDQYYFNDIDSALTVLLINVLLGISAALFLLGRARERRYGLIGLMGLSVFIILSQSIFLIVTLGHNIYHHDPLGNWWAILL
jgi:hypothetical protein